MSKTKRRPRTAVLLATMLLAAPALVSGCDKQDDEAKAKPVEVIPKQSNGSPVAAKFVRFVGEGEARGVEILLYNHGDRTAAGMVVLLRYYDAKDQLLVVKEGTPFQSDSDFTSVSGSRYMIEPSNNATFELDGRSLGVPAAATRAELAISKVDALAGDGKAIENWWGQDNFNEWPAE